MAFTLRVEASPWRTHQDEVRSAVGRAGAVLVPVVKGNGYGLGQDTLAREARRLGADVIAVGTIAEVDDCLQDSLGDVLVLEPFDPRDSVSAQRWAHAGARWDAARIIRTISSVEGMRSVLESGAHARVVLEATTSMHRFGLDERELRALLADDGVREAIGHGRLQVLGLAVHLPLEQPDPSSITGGPSTVGTPRAQEALSWARRWQSWLSDWSGAHTPAPTLWVSHLSDGELADLTSQLDEGALDEVAVNVRIGTRLWLEPRGALQASGTVLAVHPANAGMRVGYRQRSGPRDGTLIVVSGGTAHGIGLTAPSPGASLRQRVVTAGTGALDAAGRALSPFSWAGKQRWFAEPPHQHHSMLWLPRGIAVPTVGEGLVADVRFTTTRFDAVVGLGDGE